MAASYERGKTNAELGVRLCAGRSKEAQSAATMATATATSVRNPSEAKSSCLIVCHAQEHAMQAL
jgi:hypothetical protein